MGLENVLKLKGKSRFRLRLEITVVVFIMLASQMLLFRVPPLDLIVSLLIILYVASAGKELKARTEPFTPREKRILFGLVASVYGLVVVSLLVAAIIKQTPLVWIVFGLACVFAFVSVFGDYDQLYNG